MGNAELTIDLDALVFNWRLMDSYTSSRVNCGAVVKANAYGLGVEPVAKALCQAGCNSFYVSTLVEAFELKSALMECACFPSSKIFVLLGCLPGEEKTFCSENFIPVLISQEMFYRWESVCKASGNTAYESALKINTGMGRLGVEIPEFELLVMGAKRLAQAGVKYLFSHLACADEPFHPLNALQLTRFQNIVEKAGQEGLHVKTGLASSAAIVISDEYHFDMVRPGIALYGGQPNPEKYLPLKNVVSLSLPIIQLRRLPPGESVGYGATRAWPDERVIAVAQYGYADGISRQLGNSGVGVVKQGQYEIEVPIVGRISMDSTTFDVTHLPFEPELGMEIELLGAASSIDLQSERANTISYELLTSLGRRFNRKYLSKQFED